MGDAEGASDPLVGVELLHLGSAPEDRSLASFAEASSDGSSGEDATLWEIRDDSGARSAGDGRGGILACGRAWLARTRKQFASWADSEGRRGALADARVMIRNGMPLVFSNLARYLLFVTDVVFLGHIDDGTGGKVSLAAAAAASSWINCSWWFFLGVIWSMDSLVSQAQGAGNLPLIGIILQSELFVVSLLALPAAVAYWVTGDVLSLFGFQPEICEAAALFARVQMIGILPMHWYRTLLKWLESQAITKPGFYMNFLGVLINILLNYVLIFGLFGFGDLGFVGSPLATALTRWVMITILTLFLLLSGVHRSSWHGWKLEALSPRRLWPVIRYGLPAALMLGFEVLAFEIQTLLSGFLGEDEIASFSVAMNVMLLTAASGVALTSSGAQRVGYLLGEGLGAAASRASAVAMVLTFLVQLSMGLFVFVFRGWIPLLFTSNEAVRAMSSWMLVAVMFVTVIDGLQSVVGGLLRTAGRPNMGTVLLLTGVMVVGTPTSVLLTFVVGWTVFGLWIGLFVGLAAFVLASLVILFLFTDWDHESRMARLRSEVTTDFELTEIASPVEEPFKIEMLAEDDGE